MPSDLYQTQPPQSQVSSEQDILWGERCHGRKENTSGGNAHED